jgi:hypothetical protein
VSNTLAAVRSMRWTIITSIALGIFLAPAGSFSLSALMDVFDARNPVVDMRADLVRLDTSGAVLHLYGHKLRACQYLALDAYAISDSGVMSDINIERIDIPADGNTKPLGTFDVGQWRAWPVAGTKRIVLYVQHNCSGRLIQTRISELPLTTPK